MTACRWGWVGLGNIAVGAVEEGRVWRSLLSFISTVHDPAFASHKVSSVSQVAATKKHVAMRVPDLDVV